MKRSATTTTASSISVSGEFTYVIDAMVSRAIERVFRKALRWKGRCCGKKTGMRFCENFGCESLDELLQPLKQYRPKRIKAKGIR